MGKFTKVTLIGLLAVTGAIVALQSIGNELESEFQAQAANSLENVESVKGSTQTAGVETLAEEVAESPNSLSRGTNILEQAIFDAFPSDGSQPSSDAKDFIAYSINTKGFLCAEPVEMRNAGSGHYGIGCIINRDGTGAAIYLVHPATGNVTQL